MLTGKASPQAERRLRPFARRAAKTRRPATVGLGDLGGYITYGASPRASINMILSAKALAFLRGRE